MTDRNPAGETTPESFEQQYARLQKETIAAACALASSDSYPKPDSEENDDIGWFFSDTYAGDEYNIELTAPSKDEHRLQPDTEKRSELTIGRDTSPVKHHDKWIMQWSYYDADDQDRLTVKSGHDEKDIDDTNEADVIRITPRHARLRTPFAVIHDPAGKRSPHIEELLHIHHALHELAKKWMVDGRIAA